MQWPWSKDKGESDLAKDALDREDDPGYEEVDDAGDGEAEDTLDDLEPELKARWDKALAATKAEMVAEQRVKEERLREWGLDFTSDGSPAIRDHQRVAAWAKDLVPREAPAARANPAMEAEAEEEIDFFNMDAAKFNALVQKQAGKIVQGEIAKMQQQSAWQESEVRSMAARDALRRAEGVISRHSPHFAPLLQHPDFEQTLLEALANTPPEQLRDDRNLAAMIGGVGAFLDMEKLPKGKGRDREGRFASTQASRASLAQVGPSRDSSRSGAPRSSDDEAARQFLSDLTGREMSAKDVDAAANPSITEWRKARAAKR